MDEKTKELIAIGASVTARCQNCLKYHIKKAKDLNCSEEEINNAIEIGNQVNRGGWSMMNKEIEKLKDSKKEKETKSEEDDSNSESKCDCGGCC